MPRPVWIGVLRGPAMSRYASATLLLLVSGCATDRILDGRPYGLTVPANAETIPHPLVVLLHGFGANGAIQDQFFPFSKEAEARQFLYAQPNGTLDRRGRRFWNGTDACCAPEDVEVDDVAFLRAVIHDVQLRYAVDSRQVFLVSHSNGGFMALRMACEAGDLVTGVVSVAGAAWSDFSRCGEGGAVPVLQIHGTTDSTIRSGGGATDFGPYPSATQTVASFAAHNGCGTTASPLEPSAERGPGSLSATNVSSGSSRGPRT